MSIQDISLSLLGTTTSITSILVIVYVFTKEQARYHQDTTGDSTEEIDKISEYIRLAILLGVGTTFLLIISILLESDIQMAISNIDLSVTLTVSSAGLVILEMVAVGYGIYWAGQENNN
jgi:putative exporter of polyketide antibiotics